MASRLRVVLLTVLAAAAGAATGAAAEPVVVTSLDEPVPLAGGFPFRPGDDPSWAAPGLDDSGWSRIRVPGSWGRQGYPDVDVAWYRLHVVLDPALLDDGTVLGLRMGNVDTGYELYAGGILLGGVGGPPPEMVYDRHLTFKVPRRAVAADGTLVLALRVWRGDAAGPRAGGIRQAPRLGRLEALTREALADEVPSLVLAAIFLVVAFYHLQLFRRRPEERVYLWYSLFVLDTAVYVFLRSQLRFVLSGDYVFLKEVEYVLAFALPALGVQFLWTLLEVPIGRVLRLYQLSHPALGLVAALTPGLALNLAIIEFWIYWSLPVVVLSFGLIARQAWRGDPDARTIGVGSTILLATYFHDVLSVNNVLPPRTLGPLGFAVFIFSMAFSLANRFNRVHRQLDALKSDLEKRVDERTRELEGAMVAAEAGSRAKSEFLANMSHEIRTPMHAILGVLGMLDEIDLPEPAREHTALIGSSAEDLLQIIDDILDFSKIEAGKLELAEVDFELRDTVRAVIDLMTPRAAAKGVALRLDVAAGVPSRLRGDPVRLRQVLLNLVDNAVKFTFEGEVRVGVESAETPERLRFTVRDTGIGIPEEVRSRLFEPFTQADSSAARRFGGTGLGLAISRRLIVLMDGEIGVESVPGEGATFRFVARFAPPSGDGETAPDERPPHPEATRDGYRVLLAEDDPVNRMIAERQVASLGYRVDAVANGLEALAALERRPYDLVLMDCQMPELDGYEATRRLRQREIGDRHTPVVAVTAHAMEGDREKCLAAGMDGYLSKPYRVEKLAAVLEEWLTGVDPLKDRAS